MDDVGARRKANFSASPILDRVSSARIFSADFRLWTIARVKKFYPSNFTQSRRRVLAAILLAPLSAIFPTYLNAAVSTRFRLSHGDKRIAIQGPYGSWVIDLRHLASDAIATATRHPGEFRVVLSNARIRGRFYVDFKAVLRLEDGVLTLQFDRLGLAGELNFDAWAKGNPLVLRGPKTSNSQPNRALWCWIRSVGDCRLTLTGPFRHPLLLYEYLRLNILLQLAKFKYCYRFWIKARASALVLIGDEFVTSSEDLSYRYLFAGYLLISKDAPRAAPYA